MRTTLIAAAIVAASFAGSTAANAADLGGYKDAASPIPAAPTWTGFYIGGHGGYGQSVSGQDAAVTGVDTVTYTYPNGYNYTERATTTGIAAGADQSGFLYGAQLGYWGQFGGLAIGAQFDFSGSSIAGDKANVSKTSTVYNYSDNLGNSFTSDPQPGHVSTEAHSSLNWISTATLQAGVPWGNIMPYLKAGVAFGEVQDALSIGDGSTVLNHKAVETGWTAGGGVLWAVSQNWRLFWEFDYYNMGSHSMAYTDATSYNYGDGYRADTTNDIRKASVTDDYWATKFGVNYQLTSSYTPLK